MKLGEYSIDIYKEKINGKDKRNEYLLKKLQELDSEAKEAEDIYAEAKEINEERAAQDAELGADVTVEETDITEDAEESAEQE